MERSGTQRPDHPFISNQVLRTLSYSQRLKTVFLSKCLRIRLTVMRDTIAIELKFIIPDQRALIVNLVENSRSKALLT